MAELTMVKALNLALHQNMEADPRVIICGQDVGRDEGVFRVTEGLYNRFGESRVLDSPLAEAGIIATSIGMALYGLRPIAEIQFSGFIYQGFHQIEQHMARFRNRTRGRLTVPMVLRAPYGGGIRAVEHHSESKEAYWVHTPGLKVVIPSGPRAARALLHAAISDPDPVIFYEPKILYRAFREEVPDEPESWEIGKARIVRPGNDITLISYGSTMRVTQEAGDDLADLHNIDAEVIDLMTIKPMDTDTIVQSVRKTGRAVVIHEGHRTCGVGAEIIARLNEQAFDYLEAPIRRVTGYDIHFPYFSCEQVYLPDAERIVRGAMDTLNY
ncbi:MAG: Pyruvate dehydrogenase E1 component subunit beta [Phycisphaerae bacterium]|nr:Pyruvate dehydrogenase E1 component subunit beta [Phycisphaerae bacterium]